MIALSLRPQLNYEQRWLRVAPRPRYSTILPAQIVVLIKSHHFAWTYNDTTNPDRVDIPYAMRGHLSSTG
jgi:hypothetical protein